MCCYLSRKISVDGKGRHRDIVRMDIYHQNEGREITQYGERSR